MAEQASTAQSIRKPIVIPQTTKSIRGAFWSPFIRAYPPHFAAQGISRDDFIRFVDELNEAFLASPVFQITNAVGAGMGFAPYHPVAWAGLGVQVASGLVSAGVSYGRARSYIRKANTDLFGPIGYRATVLTTRKMMEKVGIEGGKLQLPDRIHPARRNLHSTLSDATFAPIPENNEEIIATFISRQHSDQTQPSPYSQSESAPEQTDRSSSFIHTSPGEAKRPQTTYQGPHSQQNLPQVQSPVVHPHTSKIGASKPTGQGNLQMPDLGQLGIDVQDNPEDDPRLRRLKALEGYVEPLEIETSPATLPDNVFKRMGMKRAAKMGEKQTKKLRKKQAKSDKRVEKADPDLKIQRLQQRWQKKQARAQRRLAKNPQPVRQRKIVAKLEKDMEGFDRKIHEADTQLKGRESEDLNPNIRPKADMKQEKIANKIRWVVILPLEPSSSTDEDDVPISDGELSATTDDEDDGDDDDTELSSGKTESSSSSGDLRR